MSDRPYLVVVKRLMRSATTSLYISKSSKHARPYC